MMKLHQENKFQERQPEQLHAQVLSLQRSRLYYVALLRRNGFKQTVYGWRDTGANTQGGRAERYPVYPGWDTASPR